MADGPKTVVSTATQDILWKGYDRRFFPVYTAKQEATVKAILGPDFDRATNLNRATAAAEKYAEASPKDIDGWRNLGYLYYAEGDCKSALNVWEQHLTKMLAPSSQGPYNHFLWYQLWPVECYNKLGNYQQVIKIAPNELAQARIYAELRYEYAFALVNTGRKAEAIDQLKKALLDDQYYKPAITLLDKLQVS
jgi:tetratricopeptide (TPR) repeat protein